MSKSKASTKESQTYQAMLTELDDIVRHIGQGQLDLDDIVEKIEHGYKLIGTMRERLDATKDRVEKLRVDFEGGAATQSPMDLDEESNT
jgi:exodeoxyribonuclease VII small subunit